MPSSRRGLDSTLGLRRVLEHLRRFRAAWVRFTRPDLDAFLAKKTKLVHQLEARYELQSDEAARIVDEWIVVTGLTASRQSSMRRSFPRDKPRDDFIHSVAEN
jgi:hypothetical protein